MANLQDIKRKDVCITLKDGTKRELLMSLEAFAEMEEKYGSVEQAMATLEQNKVKDIKFLLWAATLHDYANPITESQLAASIDVRKFPEVIEKLTQVMQMDAPAPVEGISNSGVDPN